MSREAWFYEIKRHGKWCSVVVVVPTGQSVSLTRPEGSPIPTRQEPLRVPPILRGRDLDDIAKCLSPDGEFYGVDIEAVAAFLNGEG